MLHYYVKRFFSRTLISPIDEDGLLKVYYVDDDAWTRGSQSVFRHPTRDLDEKDSLGGARHGFGGRQHQDVVRMVERDAAEDAEVELRIRCYHWMSMEERKSWKVTVKEVRRNAYVV